MSWNYRIMKHVENGELVYLIHEVYYNKKGKIWGWTTSPSTPQGISYLELMEDYEKMKDAFGQDILNFNMKPEAKGPRVFRGVKWKNARRTLGKTKR